MGDPVRSIAEALWQVDQGYTVEDIRAVGGDGSVDWHPDVNEEDAEQERLFMGNAQRVLEHLIAAGWTPPWKPPSEDDRYCPVCTQWVPDNDTEDDRG